jgi:hypothetical protein
LKCVLLPLQARPTVKIPSVFSDHVVLQREDFWRIR